MSQIPLTLYLPAVFLAENFFISACNKTAYDAVLGKWESHALYLYGQKGAGKSHLASILAQKNGAEVVFYNLINHAEITSNIVVEDIENCTDETALFHLFNHCKNSGIKLLITSAVLPAALPFKLPDLTSRLRACPLASINEPDDELLSAVLRKQFSDRQLLVDDAVIAYLLPRMERSFAGIKELVEKLDENALAQQRNITVAFARKII